MKKILFILTLITITSCASLFDLEKTDKSTKDTVTKITEKSKKGGETILTVPKIIYKDTTIYTVNRQTKTILSTRFDKTGAQTISCLEEAINEKNTIIEESIKANKETLTELKNEFNPQYIIYAIALLGFILIIGMILFLYIFNGFKKSIPNIISSIQKS